MKVASYNCRGLPKSHTYLHTRPDILNMFEFSDILAFQETWFAKQDLHLCDSLHSDFLSCSVTPVDYSSGILIGRPHGGVSFFYRKSLAKYITPVYYDNCNWCIGINFTVNDVCFTLINVYLPYECNNNSDEYIEKLSILESIIENTNNSCYAILGDFNANVLSDRSNFANYAIDFCERNDMIFSSKELLPTNSYTYISERWGTNSWLDYIFSSPDFHKSIGNMNINYDITNCDHIPFNFTLSTSALPCINVDTQNDFHVIHKKTPWRKFSQSQFDLYDTFTDLYCNSSKLRESIPQCSDCNCKSDSHLNMLNRAYTNFVQCLLESSEKVCKTSPRRVNTRQNKPGWSEYVKDKHSLAIDSYKV